jgi:hypothetical protein
MVENFILLSLSGMFPFLSSSPHLRRRVDGEAQLGLFAVVDREALQEEGREPRAGAAAKRVEDEKALEAGALVGHTPDPVHRHLYLFFP